MSDLTEEELIELAGVQILAEEIAGTINDVFAFNDSGISRGTQNPEAIDRLDELLQKAIKEWRELYD